MHLKMVGMPDSSQFVDAAHVGHQGMAAAHGEWCSKFLFLYTLVKQPFFQKYQSYMNRCQQINWSWSTAVWSSLCHSSVQHLQNEEKTLLLRYIWSSTRKVHFFYASVSFFLVHTIHSWSSVVTELDVNHATFFFIFFCTLGRVMYDNMLVIQPHFRKSWKKSSLSF